MDIRYWTTNGGAGCYLVYNILLRIWKGSLFSRLLEVFFGLASATPTFDAGVSDGHFFRRSVLSIKLVSRRRRRRSRRSPSTDAPRGALSGSPRPPERVDKLRLVGHR